MKIYFATLLCSVVISVTLGCFTIPILRKHKAGQAILSYVKEHKNKGGTPTMGGLFIIPSAVIASLLFGNKENIREILSVLAIGVSYLVVGFIDDYIKIKFKRNEGLKPYQKIIFQMAIAILAAIYCYVQDNTKLIVPFWGIVIDVDIWIIPLVIFVFLATTNCVNLTDGLDGLAGGVSYVYLIMLSIIILMQNALKINNIDNNVIICLSLSGAIIGFLLYNTNKASIFMGDTGSLSLGAFISSVSIFSRNLLFIPILGIIFVLSGISVILQVIYFKRTGKRIFLMAPLHHHIQMLGYSESKIAFAYKLLTFVLGVICILFI